MIEGDLQLVRSLPRKKGPPFGSALFRLTFVPSFLIFSLAPWIVYDRLGGWSMASTTRTTATAGVLLLAMLFVWLAEQVYPENADWNANLFSDGLRGWRRLGRDFIYLFGVTQVTALLITAADPYVTSTIGALRFGLGALWPAGAPFPVRIALAFFLIEFFSYWFHRSAHRFRILWQFHSTHHVITELNGLKSVRTHPIDNLLFYVGRIAPLMWLGAGLDELLAATYFGGILGILAHANVRVSERGLGLIFNLPRCHSVHHSADLAEAGSNFGCHTVLWDRVFGTFRSAPRPGLALGVDPVGPRSLWQELVWPFYRAVSPRR